ncbi:MAG TPA: nuclear transport factor 2 family protein [Bacteroidales bacterium]|nr:nuclear transport factor 2 family protein [Bacteroidales bacterium]
MKTATILLIATILFSIGIHAQQDESAAIDQLLTDWHNAAANVQQDEYFSYFDEDAVYIGTDSTEIWTKAEFYEWSKPHFEKQKTWTFVATHRSVYFSEDGTVAWFDELIDYGKGTLRGSGVLQKKDGVWKIKQYVLSVPVPNEKFKSVMEVINKD